MKKIMNDHQWAVLAQIQQEKTLPYTHHKTLEFLLHKRWVGIFKAGLEVTDEGLRALVCYVRQSRL